MNPLRRIVDAVTGSDSDETTGQPATAGPAAASGDTAIPKAPPVSSANEGEDELSAGPSAADRAEPEISLGGADAVPDTPDVVAEDYT